MSVTRPEPVDKEIVLDPSKVIMSKTDSKGIVMYANDYFMEICGYLESELMGEQHNIIRHPDMPRVVFKLLWDRLDKGGNIHALVKNLAKDGRYYWVVTNFETKFNEQGEVIAHYSRRKAAPEAAVKAIEKVYKVLVALEVDDKSMALSGNYLMGKLEEAGKTYDEFILEVLGTTEEELQTYFTDSRVNINVKEKKSLFKKTPKEKPAEKKKGFFGKLLDW